MSGFANKLTEEQKVLVRAFVSRQRLRGFTFEQIKSNLLIQLGIELAISTIHDYYKQVEAEWIEGAQQDIAAIKARELATLDEMKAELFTEWERSKEDKTRRTTDAEGNEFTATENQTGDARYMSTLVQISKRRSELLGMDIQPKDVKEDSSANAAAQVNLILNQYSQGFLADPASDISEIPAPIESAETTESETSSEPVDVETN